MERIGFGLFGSPIGLNYVSNGLFKTLQIEGETYLNLPNGVELSKGERIAKISRQVYSPSHIEVIKIYIYEHAVSFDKRGGGFIGSAYVFVGNPTQTLLYHAVKHLHPKVFSLLDDNRKFKSPDFNLTERDLINANTTGLIDNQPRKTTAPTDKNDYLVLTDGSLFNHLMSATQGFMYNPNFRNVDHIYVSEHQNLLKRIANNDEKSILGLGHLLNFQNHFNSLNKKLQEKDQKRLQLEKDIQEKERKATAELENKIGALNLKIDKKQKSINQKDDQITQLENDIISKQNDFKRLKQESQSGKKEVSNLKQEISTLKVKEKKLKEDNYNSFKKILNNPDFKAEKEKYDQDNPTIQKLNEDNSELEKRLEEIEDNKIPIQKKLLILGSILLLFLTGGYFLGDFYPLINKPKTQQTQQVEITSTPKEETSEKKETFKKENELPPSYTLKDFLELSSAEQKTHKKKLDDFIQKLDQESSENQKAFFERKWNIGELINNKEFNENMVLTGLSRITEIKNLYENNNQEAFGSFDSKFGLMEIEQEFSKEEITFKSSKRNEILKEYLKLDRNIYEPLNIDINLANLHEGFDLNLTHSAKQTKEILIYMHFRWMIYKLSAHENDADKDLKTTNQKTHKVLLIKDQQ